MAAAHPLGCARTVDILNAAPKPVRWKIKVNLLDVEISSSIFYPFYGNMRRKKL
jgi:hypothetical protein